MSIHPEETREERNDRRTYLKALIASAGEADAEVWRKAVSRLRIMDLEDQLEDALEDAQHYRTERDEWKARAQAAEDIIDGTTT